MTQHVRRATWVAAFALLTLVAAPCHAEAQRFAPTRVAPAAHRPVPRARVVDTLAFAHRALRDRRIELVPALEQMGERSGDDVVARPMLAGAAAELRLARARAGTLQLLDRTAASLDAMCADAEGSRARACRSLAIDLTAARAHARAGRRAQARRALVALARHADEAVRVGAFVAWEGTVIAETARYATERV